MTAVLEPEVEAKRVCLFCKENDHDVTMQECEGKSGEGHYFCPCCDRLDRKTVRHLIEEIDLPTEPAAKPGPDDPGFDPEDPDLV